MGKKLTLINDYKRQIQAYRNLNEWVISWIAKDEKRFKKFALDWGKRQEGKEALIK